MGLDFVTYSPSHLSVIIILIGRPVDHDAARPVVATNLMTEVFNTGIPARFVVANFACDDL